eukprot:10416994-Karenia_brevis.AAC.1
MRPSVPPTRPIAPPVRPIVPPRRPIVPNSSLRTRHQKSGCKTVCGKLLGTCRAGSATGATVQEGSCLPNS